LGHKHPRSGDRWQEGSKAEDTIFVARALVEDELPNRIAAFVEFRHADADETLPGGNRKLNEGWLPLAVRDARSGLF
jgi:hypothetical protein